MCARWRAVASALRRTSTAPRHSYRPPGANQHRLSPWMHDWRGGQATGITKPVAPSRTCLKATAPILPARVIDWHMICGPLRLMICESL